MKYYIATGKFFAKKVLALKLAPKKELITKSIFD